MENVRAELEKRGKSLAAEKIELMDKVKQVRNMMQNLNMLQC